MPKRSLPTSLVAAPPDWWWYDATVGESIPVGAFALMADGRIVPCVWDISGLWPVEADDDTPDNTRLIFNGAEAPSANRVVIDPYQSR